MRGSTQCRLAPRVTRVHRRLYRWVGSSGKHCFLLGRKKTRASRVPLLRDPDYANRGILVPQERLAS